MPAPLSRDFPFKIICRLPLTLVLFVLVAATLVSSGQSTFNIRWHYNAPTIGMNVWENENGFFVHGVHLDSTSGNSIGFLNQRSLDGSDVQTSNFGSMDEQYLDWWGENTLYGDTTVVLTLSEIQDTTAAALLWIDPEGEIIRKKFFKSPYAELSGDAFGTFLNIGDVEIDETNDRILICHGASNDMTGNDVFFHSLNPVGEVIWTAEIATELGYESCFSFEVDDGICKAMVTQSGQELTVNRIYELNVEGDQISTTDVDLDFGFAWDQISDSNGITCGSMRSFWPLGNQALIFQIDEQGQSNWEILLGEDFYFQQEFNQIEATNDGNYVLMGRYFDQDPSDPEINGEDNWYGWLVKVSPMGDLLWERKFTSITSIDDFHTLHDMKPTSDGGYVMCGAVFDNWVSESQMTPYQQAWLIKTDEYGCVVPGCHVGVEEYENPKRFLFGPNPVSGMLNVYLKDVLLANDAKIFIYDMTGIVVESFAVRNGDVTYMLDVSELASANYVIALESGGRVLQSEKLTVLQR